MAPQLVHAPGQGTPEPSPIHFIAKKMYAICGVLCDLPTALAMGIIMAQPLLGGGQSRMVHKHRVTYLETSRTSQAIAPGQVTFTNVLRFGTGQIGQVLLVF